MMAGPERLLKRTVSMQSLRGNPTSLDSIIDPIIHTNGLASPHGRASRKPGRLAEQGSADHATRGSSHTLAGCHDPLPYLYSDRPFSPAVGLSSGNLSRTSSRGPGALEGNCEGLPRSGDDVPGRRVRKPLPKRVVSSEFLGNLSRESSLDTMDDMMDSKSPIGSSRYVCGVSASVTFRRKEAFDGQKPHEKVLHELPSMLTSTKLRSSLTPGVMPGMCDSNESSANMQKRSSAFLPRSKRAYASADQLGGRLLHQSTRPQSWRGTARHDDPPSQSRKVAAALIRSLSFSEPKKTPTNNPRSVQSGSSLHTRNASRGSKRMVSLASNKQLTSHSGFCLDELRGTPQEILASFGSESRTRF